MRRPTREGKESQSRAADWGMCQIGKRWAPALALKVQDSIGQADNLPGVLKAPARPDAFATPNLTR
jgi:hypothetical protein